ncbi:MAG: flagellar basal body rod protein FlgC [Actinomycetota bacterium]|jgi:flagellar basal-body rod protein FlgC|nr:flagellar basal body rod protein FlgC [Actinomycetota bacterium]MDI7251830.1 flagellar basal body rod protein FlgC [Actinomycetota bacterium]
MGLFNALNISASGMTAHRMWMDVIASNIANSETTRTPEGGPYRRREVVFSAEAGTGADDGRETGRGVKVVGVVEDQGPPRLVYEPDHPDAREDGYVEMPNVNPVTEMVDLVVASRAYEANATALEAAKSMFTRALDILR